MIAKPPWARYLKARSFEVSLLPPHYVGPYRRRNKTDRADAEAILEADRCAGIKPVAVKSEDQQALIGLHRVRAQWMACRTARINTMRGLLAEFGVTTAPGSKRFLNDVHMLLARKQEQLPDRVRRTVLVLWDEVQALEERIELLETELEGVALQEPVIQTLRTIPGIGLLTATALFAAIVDIHAFPSGRQLACWLGLTPREHSSGGQRRLGRISKQGDPYLRMFLVHGARSALNAARRRESAGNGPKRPFNPIGSRCANPMVARSNRSTIEAGYTTAADSLCLRREVGIKESTFLLREVSIYGC